MCVRFVKLLCTKKNKKNKNKNKKLESDVPKPYLKKSPFFAHAVNSI